MPITLKEIAQLTGVSRPAISMLINNPETSHLSAEKKRLVMAALEKYHYRPNYAARKLKGGSGQLLGIIGPLFNVPVHSALIKALMEALRHLGYRVLPGDHGDDPQLEQELVRDFEMRGVDGFFLLRPLSEELFRQMRVPSVVLTQDHPRFDVGTDLRLAGRLAGEHLLAHGHRKIGFVAHRPEGGILRRGGLAEALSAAGIDWEPEWLICESQPDWQELLLRQQRLGVTAFFCHNDYTAAAVMKTLQEAGIPVPEAAAVIGFDGLSFARLLSPSLTTLRQPVEALAQAAIERMMARLGGHQPEAAQLLPPDWVFGGSCGCASAQEFAPVVGPGLLMELQV